MANAEHQISPYASTEATSRQPSNEPAASGVRFQVVGISVAMAFILYIDRNCLGEIVKSDSFKLEFGATKEQIGSVLGAFYFTYAVCQMPAGWLSDRFGARLTLPIYIGLWSIMTGLTGLASSLSVLLVARLLCGMAQAGAYPTSGGVIRRWFPLQRRTMASSWVALGGRTGAMLAPALTTLLALQIGGWRLVLGIYFVVGIVIAIAYRMIVRDAPSKHSGVNEAERNLIGVPLDTNPPSLRDVPPMLLAFCCSPALWLCSLSQFSVNVGWAFLPSWLPTFIAESHQVSAAMGSVLVSLVLGMAIIGQLIGGWLGDYCVKRYGLRWGRILPLAIPSLLAAIAYMMCPMFQSVWLVVLCCGMVSLMNDVANPSIWGFVQDVGGPNTAAVYGWMNMWGNLGAALSAIMVPKLLALGDTPQQGTMIVFCACASGFLVAAIASLGISGAKPLRPASS